MAAAIAAQKCSKAVQWLKKTSYFTSWNAYVVSRTLTQKSLIQTHPK